MSGTVARRPTPAPGSNIVPMPAAMPNPMMWGGGGGVPGCCPPGDMSSLAQCYCDVQAALQFFSKVMVDLMTYDPAVQAAMVAGIEQSGSSLPLIGVTNGSDAQPGQVGEFVFLGGSAAYATTAANAIVNMGILQPGDWDIWSLTYFSAPVSYASTWLTPVPAGVVGNMGCASDGVQGENFSLVGPTARALISVPTLLVLQLATNTYTPGTGAGTATIAILGRRCR